MSGQGVQGQSEYEDFAKDVTRVIASDVALLHEAQARETWLRKRKKLAAISDEPEIDKSRTTPLVLRLSSLIKRVPKR